MIACLKAEGKQVPSGAREGGGEGEGENWPRLDARAKGSRGKGRSKSETKKREEVQRRAQRTTHLPIINKIPSYVCSTLWRLVRTIDTYVIKDDPASCP